LNPGDIVINELLAHSDGGVEDWVELANTTTDRTIDLTGWFLSDTADQLDAYALPATILEPGQYVAFNQVQHFGGAFALSELGDDLYLTSRAPDGTPGGYREDEHFDASDRGVTFGRYEKPSGGKDFVFLAEPTYALPNALPKVGPVVINEIMYNPQTGGHEFIELANLTGEAVPLHDAQPIPNPWEFSQGLDFAFPPGASVPANGYALVVKVDPAEFLANHVVPDGVPVYGPYAPFALANGGETLALSKPGDPEPDGFVPFVLVEKVTYDDFDPWPTEPDGLGPSLERRVAGAYGNDVSNWAASVSSGGTPGAANTAGPPVVAAVVLNPHDDRTERGVSEIDPSALGVQTVRVTFSEEVMFAPADVTAEKVEFDDDGNPIGSIEIPAENFTASATAPNEMTITFANSWQQMVDTWVRITLADTITDLDSNPLDGEPAANSAGLGYIYDAALDLPSGNGAAGGDAVFYVGNLRGDMRGFGPEPENDPPNGTIDSWDIGGFTQKFQERNLDADFRGFGPEPENDPPEGDVNSWDIGGFTSRYSTALATGAHLGNLPTDGGGGMAAGAPSPLPPPAALTDSPETALLAEASALNDPQAAIRTLPFGSRLKVAQDADLTSVVLQSEMQHSQSPAPVISVAPAAPQSPACADLTSVVLQSEMQHSQSPAPVISVAPAAPQSPAWSPAASETAAAGSDLGGGMVDLLAVPALDVSL